MGGFVWASMLMGSLQRTLRWKWMYWNSQFVFAPWNFDVFSKSFISPIASFSRPVGSFIEDQKPLILVGSLHLLWRNCLLIYRSQYWVWGRERKRIHISLRRWTDGSGTRCYNSVLRWSDSMLSTFSLEPLVLSSWRRGLSSEDICNLTDNIKISFH